MADTISINCPKCGKPITVKVGTSSNCPHCGASSDVEDKSFSKNLKKFEKDLSKVDKALKKASRNSRRR